ncbi:MAG: hypothetical protein Q8L48_17460 [Archangium sp.]|nr:hypothetical protein [Archangium sp.]
MIGARVSRLALLLLSTVATAEAPAREYTWAGALEELPKLAQYAPLASEKTLNAFAPKTLYARVGGRCVGLARSGNVAKAELGQGIREGHNWRWELTITLAPQAVTIDGPVAIHGLDRVGDVRTFRDAPPVRTFVAGPLSDTRLPLFPKAHTLEIGCWGQDSSTRSCSDGGKEVCKGCSLLRILGGPRGGQRLYGDGVIRADFTKECGDPCGAGLRWGDFEALAGFVKKTPVVVADDVPAGQVFATKEACSQSEGSDLATNFNAVEPAVPPR